jgi:hypothetical protein
MFLGVALNWRGQSIASQKKQNADLMDLPFSLRRTASSGTRSVIYGHAETILGSLPDFINATVSEGVVDTSVLMAGIVGCCGVSHQGQSNYTIFRSAFHPCLPSLRTPTTGETLNAFGHSSTTNAL